MRQCLKRVADDPAHAAWIALCRTSRACNYNAYKVANCRTMQYAHATSAGASAPAQQAAAPPYSLG